MAKNKKNQDVNENLQADEALSRTEKFVEEHQKPIVWVLVAVLVVIAAIALFKSQYIAPKNVEAANKMAQCMYYFEQDSFKLALNGDGMNEGFMDIANGYSFTESKNLARYYSAVCCYQLGQYDEAVKYLDKFKTKSVNMRPAAITLKGDCYVSLNQIDKALKCFEEAAKIDNSLTAPRALNKAGICYESKGDYAKAIECYETIKDKYFESQLAQDIDKRIERCKIAK